MLKTLIAAILQAYVGWQRAREIARLTSELRTLSRGRVYHYSRETRARRRLAELYGDDV